MASYLIAAPEPLAAAAADFARIGSALRSANVAAAAATTQVVSAAQDEVSAAIATLFGAFGQEYQALTAQTALFHDEFVRALSVGAGAYSAA
ncbi:PE family protein, partial [Mycobacterium sp. 1423905.2]